MSKKKSILFLFLTISLIVNASKIDRGYKALNIYNYFKAKNLFEKSKKRHIVPAGYGLSLIYQRNDNPFHNIDSAYVNIIQSLNNYNSLTIKKKIKLKLYGIDSLSLIKQRNLITINFYHRAVDVNSVYGFQDFIDKNPWSSNIQKVINKRDSLYFFQQHQIGKSENYELFLKTYPNSIYANRAKKMSTQSYYLEQTKSGKIEAYEQFIRKNPTNKFVNDAQDKIYKLFTKNRSIKVIDSFIKKYPSNKNINEAWNILFELTMQKEYSKNQLQFFYNTYKNYPDRNELQNEIELSNINFLIIQNNNKWGYISENGNFSIKAQYDFVEPFSEGLALVRNGQEFYYITKTNKKIINVKCDDAFPFKNGFALVDKNEKYGVINRLGEFVLKPKYEDLGNVNENLIYFDENGQYGYLNTDGEKYLNEVYFQANDFINGFAIVGITKNKFNVINKYGDVMFNTNFNQINYISDSVYLVKKDNDCGVLSLKNDTIISINYTSIKKIDNDWFIVQKNAEFNYINFKTKDTLSKKWFMVYPEFKELATFNFGYAKVKTDKGYNYVGFDGNLLFNLAHNKLGEYNNYIAYKKKEKWGYKTPNNKIIIKPEFDKTFSFNSLGGVVTSNQKKGVVNTKGEVLIDIIYDEISFINDTIMIVKKNKNYGVITISNHVILPIDNKLIEPYSNSIVKIINDTSQYYYNFKKNNWIGKK